MNMGSPSRLLQRLLPLLLLLTVGVCIAQSLVEAGAGPVGHESRLSRGRQILMYQVEFVAETCWLVELSWEASAGWLDEKRVGCGRTAGHVIDEVAVLGLLVEGRSRAAVELVEGEVGAAAGADAPDELATVPRIGKHAVLLADELAASARSGRICRGGSGCACASAGARGPWRPARASLLHGSARGIAHGSAGTARRRPLLLDLAAGRG